MTDIGFTAPHTKASSAGMEVLEKGGSAVDAMIAAAAMIAVQYPHMNSLGGDSFWLIQEKGKQAVAIDGCGYAAQNVDLEKYLESSVSNAIPERGPKSALTMAGTVDAWRCARELSMPSNQVSLSELLQPAIEAATAGVEVTTSLRHALDKCVPLFTDIEGFNEIFAPGGRIPAVGELIFNPRLSALLSDLCAEGLDSFYRGNIAKRLASDLADFGSPLCLQDFESYQATITKPLSVKTSNAHLYNFGAPTQGLASLLILAIYDRLHQGDWSEAGHVHHIVEATKQAFLIRDKYVVDPSCLAKDWHLLLEDEHIEKLAGEINSSMAMPWPNRSELGDTVWMGAVDQYGTLVSFIQSIYWEFGSGLVLPSYGLVWNNRGVSFSLDPKDENSLAPNRKPRHTLNPALAELDNGDRIVYGTMGGEGQPQTQAAIFTRHVYQGMSLAASIAEPRWLLGRTWGDQSTNLKLEAEIFERLKQPLRALGHDIESVTDNNELMGHAGAIRLTANGVVEAATDPRSDGEAISKTL